MFIPLTINQRRDGLKNVLIAGDTAGIFYILAAMTHMEINIFLADTGIARPMRAFPCHRSASRDRANVYYDFFDGRIGAGILRRMDCVVMPSGIDYVADVCKAYGVPLAMLIIDPGANGTYYKDVNGHVGIGEKDISISRPRKKSIKPVETTFSAWDRVSDILADGDLIEIRPGEAVGSDDDRRLLEIGIPELEVLKVIGPAGMRHIELGGDVSRVFDGLME